MDCTSNCKWKNHGCYLTSMVTSEPVAVLKKAFTDKCSNSLKIMDDIGRTILHVAASCGRLDIIEWLCEEHQSKNILQTKDKESGWTPLHRAIYYGHVDCVVYMYKIAQEWKPFDMEGISPLDLAILDSPKTNKKKGKKVKLAVVVLPFESGEAGELTLHMGDVIEILHSNRTGWAVGKLQCNGTKGLFPVNFVEELKEEEKKMETFFEPQNRVYMWGNNINFTLGLGDSKNRAFPELSETLYKTGQSVIDVVITKFHAVFLTSKGQVFTCGHGLGGRLGHCSEETLLYPTQIEMLSCYHCTAISAANHHTMVLTELGDVFTFGLNDFHQLGHSPPPTSSPPPTQITSKTVKGKNVIGIAAARFHSAVYTKDELFTFGLNGGQLGHTKGEELITTPKVVSRLFQSGTNIVNVVTSDGATLCLFENGDLFLLQDFICRKIALKMVDVVTMRMTGGVLQCKGPEFSKGEPLQIAVLQKNGLVETWRSSYKSFKKCHWLGYKLPYTKIVDIALGKYLILTMDDGQIYLGHFHTKVKKEADQKSVPMVTSNKVEVMSGNYSLSEIIERVKLERKKCDEIHLEKVPLIYRGLKCFCDPKTRTFAVIQYDPKVGMTRHPTVSPSSLSDDLKRLLHESSNSDNIHDLIIKTKSTKIPAHKFILQCRLGVDICSKILPHSDEKLVNFENTTEIDLQRWLETLYVGEKEFLGNLTIEENCDLPNDQDIVQDADLEFAKHMSNLSCLDLENPCDNTFEIEEFWNTTPSHGISKKKKKGESAIAVHKGKYKKDTTTSNKKKLKKKDDQLKIYSLDLWRKFNEVSDVIIESEDKKFFHCHKCVLTARSDYFKSMLNYGWVESSSTKSTTITIPIPANILGVVLDFFYTGQVQKLECTDDISFIGEVLVCADQLLIFRLRELCESCLAEKVILKNAVEVFQFSCTYNADQLKLFTCDFISLNLPYFLEARLLESLTYDVLRIFAEEYRKMINGMDTRTIKPNFQHRDVDKAEEERQNSLQADLNKIKARRRRSSSSSGMTNKKPGGSFSEGDSVKENNIPPEPVNDDLIETIPVQKLKEKKILPWGESGTMQSTLGMSTKVHEEKKRQLTPSPFKKKSQRERRKEASASITEHDQIKSQKDDKKENVFSWGKSPSSGGSCVTSFKDVLSEEKIPTKDVTSKKTNWHTPSKFKKKLILDDGKTGKENRYDNKRSAWSTPSSTNKSHVPLCEPLVLNEEFNNIVQVQKEEKEQHIKNSKKPLNIIQLEERAMEELKKLYEKNASDGEVIAVKRIKKVDNIIPFWDRV